MKPILSQVGEAVHLSGEWDLNVWYRASAAPGDLHLQITVEFEDGRIEYFRKFLTSFVTDRTSNQILVQGGLAGDARIVDAVITGNFSAIDRGQFYAYGFAVDRRLRGTTGYSGYGRSFMRGYVYEEHDLHLGDNVDPGPGGGEGFLSWVPAFTADRAGNAAAVDYALAVTNALRHVYGVVWYYNCDGTAATRTVNTPQLLGLGGAKPTGFTLTGTNAFFWDTTANLTLTVSEEGAFISYAGRGKDGRTVYVDNGTANVVNTSVNPTPWPLFVTENDTDTILRFPAITNGVATDVHSAYVLIEEWLVVG